MTFSDCLVCPVGKVSLQMTDEPWDDTKSTLLAYTGTHPDLSDRNCSKGENTCVIRTEIQLSGKMFVFNY